MTFRNHGTPLAIVLSLDSYSTANGEHVVEFGFNRTGLWSNGVRMTDDLTGNFAYIDNQNIYASTHGASISWDIDMRRFRIYLKEKYNVIRAYLFMGAFEAKRQDLYTLFQNFGYILIFREHGIELKGKKKGNVDVDLVFEMMRDCYTNAQMHKVVLVSGDGDYFRTISHLKTLNKLDKVILPSHKSASSLYKQLTDEYRVYLDTDAIKKKIGK